MEESPFQEPGPSGVQTAPTESFQGHLDEITAKKSKKRVAHAPNPETGEVDRMQLAKKLKSVAAATKKKVKKSKNERKRIGSAADGFIADDVTEIQEELQPQPEFSFKVPPIPKKVVIASGSVVNKAAEYVPDASMNRHVLHDLRDHETIDLNESIIHLNNIKKAQKELEAQEALKAQNKRKHRQKRSERKARKKALRKQMKKFERAAEEDGNGCKVYQVPGSPGYDECPEVDLRDDDSAVSWDVFLKDRNNWGRCRPVEEFPFAPLKELFKEWAQKALGLAVEVPNYCIDYEKKNDVVDGTKESTGDPSGVKDEEEVEIKWWCGTIIDFVGYKAIIQLEDFGTNPEKDKYQQSLSLFSGMVRPLRWANTTNKRLDPGPVVIGNILESENLTSKMDAFYKRDTISSEMLDDFTADQNQKARRLRPNGYNWLAAPCPEYPDSFRILDLVKIQGERLYLRFVDESGQVSEEDKKVIFHHKHRFLMPFMHAPTARINLLGTKLRLKASAPSPSDFPPVPEELKIEPGMKCEVLYPKSQDKLIVAMVYQVFSYGFVLMEMADLRFNEVYPEPLYRIYHITDPHLVPIGFGEKYGIEVKDNGMYGKAMPLNLSLLGERPPHPFEIGDKFEAVATCHYDFVGPATVTKKAGHLVQIHFDGWRKHPSNYQWLDPLQDEIYPAGYCEMFNVDWKGNVELT